MTEEKKEIEDTAIAIPMFTERERRDIEIHFKKNEISYHVEPVVRGLSKDRGSINDYVFYIPEKQYDKVIGILKEYFNIKEPTPFSGKCPSCGYLITDGYFCPDCELNLMDEDIYSLAKHPFVIYLRKNNLLLPENMGILEILDESNKDKPMPLLDKLILKIIIIIGAGLLLLLVYELIKV